MTIPADSVARFSSRKFILALVTLIVSSLLLCFGYIAPLVWRDVVIATVGAYITGNVVQKLAAAKTGTS